MIECWDTANLQFQGGIPDDAESIIFYVDGHFRNEVAARRRFPHLFNTGRVIGLTVLQRVPAQGDDFEPGNVVGDAGIWVAESIARGVHRPVLYMDEFDWEHLVKPSLERKFGRPLAPPGPGRRFRTIISAPDGVPDIPPEHDGKQYFFSSIQGHHQGDYDKSVLRDDFFGPPTHQPNKPEPLPAHPPIPQRPEGTTMIATYKTQDNRVGIAVETDKGEVLHIEQEAPNGDWWREPDGEPKWLSLGTPGRDDGPNQ